MEQTCAYNEHIHTALMTLYMFSTKHLQEGLHDPTHPCGSFKAASQHPVEGVCSIRGENTGGAG